MAIQRLTRQRKAVLDVVKQAHNHPDAAWVYQEVRKIVPNISLGTVYRTLDTLVEEGHLIPLTRAGEATRYDANTDGHLHMICEQCGEIIDLDTQIPDVLSEVRSRFPHLEIKSASLEYHGLCEHCRGHLES